MPVREWSSDVKPFTVRLHLHGDLDFFLGPRTRSRTLERTLGEKTSIKDVIESCGVPHPEVDVILIDGQAVGFEQTLIQSAVVDIFPVGDRHTQTTDKHLQIVSALMFVADGHLGGLARNLRLLGFDVAYDPSADDHQLLELMTRQNRALLTRDRRLLMHAIVQRGYCPRSQNPEQQTVEVIRRFHLVDRIVPFTRCLRCNARLEDAAKADVMGNLEPLTKIYYHQFRRCPACRRIYWAGSHFEKLQKRIENIQAHLAGK